MAVKKGINETYIYLIKPSKRHISYILEIFAKMDVEYYDY